MSRLETSFTKQVGIEVPLICGAMYPCSNPELVAAASEGGGIGIIQPVSIVFANKMDLRDGIRRIRQLTDKPIGFNAIVEKSSKLYEDQMRKWIDVALEENVRFFITALGNPDWVVKKVHAVGGIVYHDITELKWAKRALAAGVDGLIGVNNRAGGHAGSKSPQELYDEIKSLGVPVVCAGGIGDEKSFVEALDIGYAGVQLGTRFIASTECTAHMDYKKAILKATAEDIVMTEKISGVPVAVINTDYVKKVGTKAGPITRRLLQHARFKHYVRMFYSIRSIWQLKKINLDGMHYKNFFQAGKSADTIHSIESAGEIIQRFATAARV